MKRLICIMIYTLLPYISFESQGQELVVRSLALDGGDLSAQYIKRLDGNGQLCALLKVTTMAQNPKFYGNLVGNVEKREGYYWVYMTAENPESRFVEMSSDNYLTLRVTFEDYGVRALSGGCTYKLTLAEKRFATTVWEEPKVEDGQPMEQPRPAAFANGLEPRWSSSVTVEQKKVLEKLVANMVKVEGGTFMMGDDNGEDDEKPAHRVTLSDYYIGKYEVTQAEWEAVMGEKLTSDGYKWSAILGDNYPVYCISWDDCDAFIRKLNELTGLKFKLPTEAEWEYAARGGNRNRGHNYSGSKNLKDVAWYLDNTYERGYPIHSVGEKHENELGLHDMSGSLEEWCSDWYGGYSGDSQMNPIGPKSGSYRVLRGGSMYSVAADCRVANRNHDTVTNRSIIFGMRLAL